MFQLSIEECKLVGQALSIATLMSEMDADEYLGMHDLLYRINEHLATICICQELPQRCLVHNPNWRREG